jgi:hypothetical protein
MEGSAARWPYWLKLTASMPSTDGLRTHRHPSARIVVRGHEKVPTGGQFKSPWMAGWVTACGQFKSPFLVRRVVIAEALPCRRLRGNGWT